MSIQRIFELKPSFSLIILPFLLGVAVFGVFKSLDLARKNSDLEVSVDGFSLELARARDVIKESKKRVNTVECRNEILSEDITALEKKLAVREQEIQEQLKNIAFLTKKFQETENLYTDLVQDAKKRSDEYMALAFENAELKAKMKSLAGLKRQVREKKGKGKSSVVAPARSQKISPSIKQPNTGVGSLAEAISLAIGGGNEGFVMKEGESTYARQVEITVQPQVEAPLK